MNKLLVSIILGLSFAAATPAQAAWYDWIPGISYFRGNQAQNQPVHQGADIEAQQPPVGLGAPTHHNSWFSGIFSNPLSGFYARFSAWWNKGKLPEYNNEKRVVQYQRTNADLSEQVRSRDAQIAAITQQLTDLRKIASDGNNSLEQIQALQKREQELQAQLEVLRKQNTNLSSAQEEAQIKLAQERNAIAEIAAKRILEAEIKNKVELDAREKAEKQRAQAQNEATIKSLKEFANGLNKQVEGFQQRAHEKLDQLDQRVLRIATAVKEKKPVESISNPLATSVTSDFLRIKSSPEADANLLHPTSEKELDRIGQHVPTDPIYAREQIARGSHYAQKILTGAGNEIPTATQEEYLKAIVALNWFFYDHALRDAKGFEEGTFVIEDKGFKLYDFFMGYIKKMNPDIKGDATDPLAHYSNNPYGYSRDASHFVHVKDKYRPYGIDMRLGEKSGELPLLPAAKKHMLFGIVDAGKQHIYVKPENHGIYYYDGLLGHIGEFTIAQVRKPNYMASTARNVLAYFGYKIGTDDAENNRKERVPAKFLKQFAEAIKTVDSLKEKEKELLKKAKQDGIQTLTSPEVAQSEAERIQELIQEYRREYDNLEHRYGREIHISNNALLTHVQAQK